MEYSIMKIKFFCPYWGSEHLDYATFINTVKKAGYDGTELILPYSEEQKAIITEEANRLGLEIIGLWGGPIEGNFEENIAIYEKHLRNACTVKPKFITAQTGKDCFTFDQNLAFIKLASAISEETGIKIVHEMHRGKFTFAPFITREYIKQLPELRLVADFSHWCNVCESMLEDQQEDINLAIERADHIHARVGFAEGPQVPDPRTPEWEEALNIHLSWWDKIINLKRQQGLTAFTITPEFGPFPYMPMMPFTQLPISSQWDINLFMKDLLSKRYNR